MAGVLSWRNWKNLIVGYRPKGGPKGGSPSSPTDLYESDGTANLPYWDMSNRVKILCKYYEEKKAEAKTAMEKEERANELVQQLRSMGYQVAGTGKGPGKHGPPGFPGTITPPKRHKKDNTTIPPGLAGLRDEEEDDDDTSEGIFTVSHKEAYLAVGTAEKIAAKHNVALSLGEDKSTPISLTDAAKEISTHTSFSRQKWMKARQDMFGLKAESAGSRLNETALVSSVLCGYLGKWANKL